MSAIPTVAAARALLQAVSTEAGIHASESATDNYRAVFTRDGVMAGIAGVLLEDAAVTRAFVTTLERLRIFQGPEGQIASNYELHDAGPAKVSFGAIVPRIDGPTWYLVGVAVAARAGVIEAESFRASVDRVLTLLQTLEYNGRHLIHVPPGGNWADEYPFHGYILYDQVLRAWALRLLAAVYADEPMARKAAAIEATIAARYWPEDAARGAHPVASLSPIGTQSMFDAAATALLGVSGLLPARDAETRRWVGERWLAQGMLPPAFSPVIHEGDPLWPALATYHLFAFRNRPHEYHNGGIWPIWLGWFALGCALEQDVATIHQLLTLVRSSAIAAADYRFEEYLHGETGQSLGTARMAYSATGVLFLDIASSAGAAPSRALQRAQELLRP